MMSFSEIINDFFKSFSEINLGGSFKEIITNPLTLLTLIACLLIFLLLIKSKNIKFDTKMITTIGIALALTTILDMLKIYHFPQGGGITIGAMLPIILISFAYGPIVGMLTGFLFGIISLFMDPYILQPVQVLFDYPLPYMALGCAGFFRNHKISGAIVAIFLRFLSHFISGVIFFGSYAPEGTSPILYSLAVNGSLIGADGIICIVILSILPVNRLIKAMRSKNTTKGYVA